MVEKKLRKEIEGIALELMEIKEELGRRLESVKKTVKPVILVLVGIFCLKIALKLLKGILSLAWSLKLYLVVALLAVPFFYQNIRARKQEEAARQA
jgi:chromate transport protein ChrA